MIMKTIIVTTSVLLSVLFLTVTYTHATEPVAGFSANPQSVTGNGASPITPTGNHAALARFYGQESQTAQRKAEQYQGLASVHGETHGKGSELALHYARLADLTMKEAEEEAILSRLHHEKNLEHKIRAIELELHRDRWTIRTGGFGGATKKMVVDRVREARELKKGLAGKQAKLAAMRGELRALQGSTETGS